MTLRKLTHARLGSHDVADAYVTSNAQAFGKPPGGERPAARSPRVVPKGKGGFAAESQKSTVPIDQVGERSDTADWRTLASASFTGARGEASKPFPQKGTLGAWLDSENSPRKSIL